MARLESVIVVGNDLKTNVPDLLTGLESRGFQLVAPTVDNGCALRPAVSLALREIAQPEGRDAYHWQD